MWAFCVWQEHSGPVELERSLDLNCQLYLVPWEHSQKGQSSTCSSLVVFCFWAMGGGVPLESLSVPADCGVLSGSQPGQWKAPPLIALPLNLCLVRSGGTGLGWKKSVF